MAWETSLQDYAASNAQVSLKEVTSDAVGRVVDMVYGRTSVTVVARSTGAIHGRVTLFGSIDGETWFDTGETELLLAGGTTLMVSTGAALRYARIDLSMATGAGSVTAKVMGII